MTLAIRSLEGVASHPRGGLVTLEPAPPGAPEVGAPVTATYALAG